MMMMNCGVWQTSTRDGDYILRRHRSTFHRPAVWASATRPCLGRYCRSYVESVDVNLHLQVTTEDFTVRTFTWLPCMTVFLAWHTDIFSFLFFSSIELCFKLHFPVHSLTDKPPRTFSLSGHPLPVCVPASYRRNPWATCSFSCLFVHNSTFFRCTLLRDASHIYNTLCVQSMSVGETVYRRIFVNDSDAGAAGVLAVSCSGSVEVRQYHCVSSLNST